MNYQDETTKQLRSFAKERGIKYLAYLNRKMLINMLKMNDEDPNIKVDPEAKARSFEAYDRWRKNPKNRDRYLEQKKKYNYRARGLPKRLREVEQTSS